MTSHCLPIRRWLVTFAGFFVVGVLGLALPKFGAHLALPLLPSGVAAAACIRWGRKMWLAVFAARIGVELWMRQPLTAVLGVAVGTAVSAVVIAWMLEKRGFDPSFSRARDVPLFILAAAIGTMLIPTLGLIGHGLARNSTAPLDYMHWIRWWSNSTTGVLVVGPMLVAVSRRSLAPFAEHWVEGCLWVLGVAICSASALAVAPAGIGRPLFLAFALLLVVVGAIRFGLVLAAFGAFFISAASGLSFAFSRGVFGRLDDLTGFVTIWAFTVALTGLNLLITSLLAERDRAGLEHLRAERRYAQIFDGSPQPFWVHDPTTLAFLLVNEAAVRQYGWSREEFLTRHVPVLAATGSLAVLLPSAGREGVEAAPEPFETRHRTRDGRVLAVEVWTRAIDLGGRRAELVFASDVTERRALGSALIDAIANEQRRIGQELHDGLGQELTGLALSARALATRAERERQPIAAGLVQLAALATSCIQAARRIAQGVSPLNDADGSLQLALEVLAGRSSLENTVVRFRSRVETAIGLDLEARNHLYRIAQEAVQNALKHARARTIEIELWVHANGLSLTINDDGVGLPKASSRSSGLGMRTMHFRAGSIGGRLVIATRSTGGVSVACEVAQARPMAESA